MMEKGDIGGPSGMRGTTQARRGNGPAEKAEEAQLASGGDGVMSGNSVRKVPEEDVAYGAKGVGTRRDRV